MAMMLSFFSGATSAACAELLALPAHLLGERERERTDRATVGDVGCLPAILDLLHGFTGRATGGDAGCMSAFVDSLSSSISVVSFRVVAARLVSTSDFTTSLW